MNSGIFLLLGSNEGDRMSHLERAADAIVQLPVSVIRKSQIYQTAAWGLEDQPDFYNQVLQVNTELDPFELLSRLQQIEQGLGRVRTQKWGPRIIDIDILLYNDEIINESRLQIPHPGIPSRRFTLVPLNEIAPKLFHPKEKKTIERLLKECQDTLGVTLVG